MSGISGDEPNDVGCSSSGDSTEMSLKIPSSMSGGKAGCSAGRDAEAPIAGLWAILARQVLFKQSAQDTTRYPKDEWSEAEQNRVIRCHVKTIYKDVNINVRRNVERQIVNVKI